MKSAARSVFVLSLFASLFALTACENEFEAEYQRTSETPNVVLVKHVVPLGHTECRNYQVVSESSQCGPSRIEHRCSEGGGPRREPICMPEIVYPTCEHTEQTCNWVKDFDATVQTRIEFDAKAKLAAGQTETFNFTATYEDGIITLKPDVSSDFYEYTFPEEVKFDYRKVGTVKFRMK